jgi:hypothetical protein
MIHATAEADCRIVASELSGCGAAIWREKPAKKLVALQSTVDQQGLLRTSLLQFAEKRH